MMKEIRLNFKNRRLVFNQYKNQNAGIRVENDADKAAEVRGVVRRGCSLSSLLFILRKI